MRAPVIHVRLEHRVGFVEHFVRFGVHDLPVDENCPRAALNVDREVEEAIS
jgi:hypothetical protein